MSGKDKEYRAINNLIFMGFILLGHITVILIKIYAYFHTNSSAVFSDALEGGVNLLAGCFAFLSLWLAAQPPDATHPYGHGKIEYFSVGFEGALVIFAAISILWKSVPRLFMDFRVSNIFSGSYILGIAIVLQSVMVFFLFWRGKKEGSQVLVAEGHHILSDVLTTVAIVIGLLVVKFTRILWIDPLLAMGVAVFILITGFKLAKSAFCGLMDSSDKELLEEISNVLNRNRRDSWVDIHKVRARRVGNYILVDLHLILPRYLDLQDAHREADEVEKILKQSFGEVVDVLIHLDPCNLSDCKTCGLHNCTARSNNHTACKIWNANSIAYLSDSE